MTRAPQESDSLLRFRKDAPRHYWRCYVRCEECEGTGKHVSKEKDKNGYPMSDRSCMTCSERGYLHDYGWRDSLVHLKRARDSYLAANGHTSWGDRYLQYVAAKRAAMPFPNLRRLDTNFAATRMVANYQKLLEWTFQARVA